MKGFVRFTLVLTAVLGFVFAANAQEGPALSAEKKKLISELVVLTKTDQQIIDITDKMLESMEILYPTIVEEFMSGTPDLSADEKELLRKEMESGYKNFSQKFRERLPVEIDYRQYVEDSIYPLYNQFFTEKELADLVAFYKTETGQKTITVMPQLFAESLKLSQQFLLPKIMDLADRIIREEMDKLKKGPPPPPPPRKN